MESSLLLRSLDDGILTLSLNRPEQRNALSPELRDALLRAVDEAAMAPSVRALVVTGEGGAFCAGGDLGRFEDLQDPAACGWISHRLTQLADAIERLQKPTIALIDGVATGAGLALGPLMRDVRPRPDASGPSAHSSDERGGATPCPR